MFGPLLAPEVVDWRVPVKDSPAPSQLPRDRLEILGFEGCCRVAEGRSLAFERRRPEFENRPTVFYREKAQRHLAEKTLDWHADIFPMNIVSTKLDNPSQ